MPHFRRFIWNKMLYGCFCYACDSCAHIVIKYFGFSFVLEFVFALQPLNSSSPRAQC